MPINIINPLTINSITRVIASEKYISFNNHMLLAQSHTYLFNNVQVNIIHTYTNTEFQQLNFQALCIKHKAYGQYLPTHRVT